jgi:hypothetical protein
MTKLTAASVVVCTVMASCGSEPGLDHSSSTPKSVQFQAEGKAVEVSKARSSSESTPDVPGISRLGSITVQLSSSRTSSRKCPLAPPRVVVMPYTATTSFEPADLTAYGTFPESLHGRSLNIEGKIFEVGRSCLAVAMSVKDVGGPLPAAAQLAGETRSGGSSQDQGPSASPEREKAAVTSDRPSAAVPRAAPPPPAPAPALPPLAPVVQSTLRPSLPDPPTG